MSYMAFLQSGVVCFLWVIWRFELYGVFENREKYGIILSYMAFFAALAAENFEKSYCFFELYAFFVALAAEIFEKSVLF